MPVERFHSIEDMPPLWRDKDDPGNLRQVALMLAFHQRLNPWQKPGVRRFRTIEEANEERGDEYRQATGS